MLYIEAGFIIASMFSSDSLRYKVLTYHFSDRCWRHWASYVGAAAREYYLDV